jgi:beta-phosphoglucomutase
MGNMRLNDELRKEYASLKNRWYIEYISRMTPDEILPGSFEFIKELKESGIKVAIGSASKNTPLILERVGMKNLFDAVVDGNRIIRAKPDPEVFLTAAKMLGIEPGRIAVFEDAVAGVRAALNAGMICIGVGSSVILSEAHSVITGLNKINLKKLGKIVKLSGYE